MLTKWTLCALVVLFAAACAPGEPIVGGEPQDVTDVFVAEPAGVEVTSWVEGLEVPWSLVFAGNGRALVSERGGRIRLIMDGSLHEEPYAEIDVAAVGEGGLMGLALHPEFPGEPYVYAMYTYREAGNLFNRVVRLTDKGESGEFDRVIIDDIPGGRVHDGGRIAFGPDGYLYVCTGEIWQPHLSQDLDSLAGKMLRLTADGEIPAGNPFEDSTVYSYGHRNPQGIAWHPETGELFSSEHGPSGELGGLRGKDEINVIRKGANYGWPDVVGAPGVEGYVDPIIMWTTATPPGGIAFYDGDLFVATLRSEALIRITFGDNGEGHSIARIERWFADGAASGRYGRLRDVVVGPDGALYVLTSNRDGRGTPRDGDDRILRITIEADAAGAPGEANGGQ